MQCRDIYLSVCPLYYSCTISLCVCVCEWGVCVWSGRKKVVETRNNFGIESTNYTALMSLQDYSSQDTFLRHPVFSVNTTHTIPLWIVVYWAFKYVIILMPSHVLFMTSSIWVINFYSTCERMGGVVEGKQNENVEC